MAKQDVKAEAVEQEVPAPPQAPVKTKAEPRYPVVYYNPMVIDERFVKGDSVYALRFRLGRFVASNEEEEQAVRKALSIYGPDKPDLWKGDDMRNLWTCKKTGFTTGNEAAKETYQERREN